ncbi:MAG TPA: sigma-70 family RNA polymerase sigma factor [Polyangiaceae bacterium]|nr:sigma-70 family RNA polymerase sigma factor [Polyangiaceae bacterium]
MVTRQPGAVLPDPFAGFADVEARQAAPTTLADIYRDHFPFVWRMVRRLGVSDAQVEDAVQDVFVVVHRRLPDFEGRSSVRTWLAGIVRRVVRDHRRTNARKPALGRAQAELPVEEMSIGQASPEENVMTTEAVRMLHELLDRLDDDKREVFILAELEQWSMAEIAEALGVKVNTASSRLRLAREAFEEAAERLRARDAWRLR